MIGIKDQCFGVEIELTGITRAEAAEALAAYFETTPQRSYDNYDSWYVPDREGKQWRIMSDGSIRAEWNDDGHYPYLTVSILNPTKGEIDSVRMKIGEIVSKSCRSTNPNLRNTEPHIWVDGKTPQWYACCPGSRDYTLLANATAEYLSVFELTHERVQNRAGKTTERRRAENVR